ncbi:hypothetical protein [Chryseobacterium koreense]|uniref:hypothetical protein n=1 Tax=Chryseobacterium koreense TaxID=232216 RepID=UPI001613A4F4|nr:hypothetical protein [Chryseobacterium koreense]MBB5334596.1 hypothetical protein [Chryseobacterium koreense]
MDNEKFPYTEAVLDMMIRTTKEAMETVEDKADYDKLHDQLKDLKEKKRQLLIINNTL